MLASGLQPMRRHVRSRMILVLTPQEAFGNRFCCGVGDFRSAGACVWRGPWRGRRSTPDAPHGPRPRARDHAKRGGLRCGTRRTIRLDQSRACPPTRARRFCSSLAHRIVQFPTAGIVALKERVNAIALAPVEDFRRDSDLFGEGARKAEAQSRFQTAFKGGFQTRDGEMDLGRLVGELSHR
jgi:hypothetical protein